MTTITATTPPPPPVHQTPLPALNISIVQPFSDPLVVTTTASKSTSYLGYSQQQANKRKSFLTNGYESSGGSSDESEGDDNHRYSTESNVSEEHKFWQVHSSTTIIAPPTDQHYIATMNMAYANSPRKSQNSKMVSKVIKNPRISLVAQVRDILGSTLDDVDEEIEREWETSRIKLRNSLMALPTISLTTK